MGEHVPPHGCRRKGVGILRNVKGRDRHAAPIRADRILVVGLGIQGDGVRQRYSPVTQRLGLHGREARHLRHACAGRVLPPMGAHAKPPWMEAAHIAMALGSGLACCRPDGDGFGLRLRRHAMYAGSVTLDRFSDPIQSGGGRPRHGFLRAPHPVAPAVSDIRLSAVHGGRSRGSRFRDTGGLAQGKAFS